MKSVPPPAGNGTIILMGFCGQLCAAASVGASSASASAATIVMMRFFIVLPPSRPHGGRDGVAHLLRTGAAAEVARQMLGLRNHFLHGRMNEAGGGRGFGLVV